MLLGVSVVICCHNSAKELPQTLAHLAAQQVQGEIPWEVIIVDNASTDGTSQVALASWTKDAPTALRVVHEPRLGLIHARYRALAEAQYEIISFIDDDNWVYPEWVQVVSEVMSQHPKLGACGGLNEAEFEVESPSWFPMSGKSYATGPQGPEAGGDITWSRGCLVGAGLTIRKSAWQDLVNQGFHSLLIGCQGTQLKRGEDTELCFALLLAGWRLWYEPRLRLRHCLETERLQWSHLRRLRRGGGAATLGFDPYRFALEESSGEDCISFWWTVGRQAFKNKHKQTWQWQALATLKNLLQRPHKLLSALIYPMEGDPDVLQIEMKIGRLLELLKNRQEYDLNIQAIRGAAWRQRHLPLEDN